MASDLPEPLDDASWLAVKGGTVDAVVRVLGLSDPQPATWAQGLEVAAGTFDGGPADWPELAGVFITPLIRGWWLVVGGYVAVPHPEAVPSAPGQYPAWDRGDRPPMQVSALRAEVEALVAAGREVPYTAYVSGPEVNIRVEFRDYQAEHKPLVRGVLMTLIGQGADRIVVASEVWARAEDGTATWDGVMVAELTPARDAFQMAEFEGKHRLGEWRPLPGGAAGNLAGLFAEARRGKGKLTVVGGHPVAGIAPVPPPQADGATLRSWLPPGA